MKLLNIKGFNSFWFSAEKKGYSGVVVYTNIEPVSIKNGFGKPEFDSEAGLFLQNTKTLYLQMYIFRTAEEVPGKSLKYKLDFYNDLFFYLEKNYRDRKGIIVTGDYNTAHKEIDKTKGEFKNSGFLPEERVD